MKNRNILIIIILILSGCSAANKTFDPRKSHYYQSAGMGMGWSIELRGDSTYTYHWGSDVGSSHSEGYWHQIDDMLILKSFVTPQIVSVKESVQTGSQYLKVYIKGNDNKESFCSSLFHIKADVRFKVEKPIDLDAIMNGEEYVPFRLPLTELNRFGRHFRIPVDEYDLNFAIQDTSTNIATVTLNVSQVCAFDEPAYFNNNKLHEFYKEVQRSKRISKIRVWHNPDVTTI